MKQQLALKTFPFTTASIIIEQSMCHSDLIVVLITKVKEYVNLCILPKSSKVVSGKTPSPIGWISTVQHSPTESSLSLSFPEEKWHQMRPCGRFLVR